MIEMYEDPNLPAVAAMLERAIREGVEAEVIQSFGDYRSLGQTVAESARCAMYNWDV